jgi:hypothetical protein
MAGKRLEAGLNQLHDALDGALGFKTSEPNMSLAGLILRDIQTIQQHTGLPLTEVSPMLLAPDADDQL